MDVSTRWTNVTDREKWAARGSSFLAKLKATKVVWFPPQPVPAGKPAASAVDATAENAATRSTRRTAKSVAKKATGAARRKTSNKG